MELWENECASRLLLVRSTLGFGEWGKAMSFKELPWIVFMFYGNQHSPEVLHQMVLAGAGNSFNPEPRGRNSFLPE